MMRISTLLLVLLLSHFDLLAQQEDSNWHFGLQAAVSFTSGAPVVQPTAMRTYEAASSISDAAGQLLFYSNGEKVWNRNHALMPNGGAISATGFSSTQGVLIVPHPGDPTLYYVFLTDDMENQLAQGLRYTTVDMKLANGLGDVTGAATRLPTPALTSKIAEKLIAVRHANGRDYWIVVHGWENNSFFSFLLTTSGVVGSPVVSSVGPVLDGVGGQAPFSNAAGHLRAAPDGRHLAMAALYRDLGLYDFDPATGQVSNYVDLTPPATGQPLRYGVEFSADNSRLYAVVASPNQDFSVVQFNMLAGSGGAIGSSWQVVGKGKTGMGGLLRAPNGKIYLAAYSSLHAINVPNILGAGCGFQLDALPLNGAATIYNLPNQCSPHSRNNFVQFTAPPTCVGTPTAFTAQLALPGTPRTSTWDFGDAAGAANGATGLQAVHTYRVPGTYLATLTVTMPGFVGAIVGSREVVVSAAPSVSLGPPVQQTCAGQALTLTVSPQAVGSTYRWQDGSTAATLTTQRAGTYTVEVTSPGGCSSQAEATVQVLDCTVVIPNIITPNQDGQNETFLLKGLHAPDWALRIYSRWGREIYVQERYDNTWTAQGHPDGIYYYLLTSPATGQQYRGWVEVRR
jgi:gliding motility-associated-like protein